MEKINYIEQNLKNNSLSWIFIAILAFLQRKKNYIPFCQANVAELHTLLTTHNNQLPKAEKLHRQAEKLEGIKSLELSISIHHVLDSL